MEIKLSILVCSVLSRHGTFLPKILSELDRQFLALTEEEKRKVEILVLTDNKRSMLGRKRNRMVEMAQGEYVVFADDDDRLAPDYVKTLLDATESGSDVISFQAEVRVNDQYPKICHYSKDNLKDYNTAEAFFRIPNHICCVKKEVSQLSSFPNITHGEDSGYSKLLLPHLQTETKIDRVLYYYDYSQETSETQEHIHYNSPLAAKKPVADVVILSNAPGIPARNMTQRTIDTCISGANGLGITVTVMEQSDAKYRRAATVKQEGKFNYNAYANKGASLGTAPWIVIANNDLVFTDGWLHTLIASGSELASPHEPDDIRQKDMDGDEEGFANGRHFSGWCFMVSRSLWRKMGMFDDCVDFWFSDDVVIEQAKALGVTPRLVKGSVVRHLGSTTLKSLPQETKDELMWVNADIFNEKYGKDKFRQDPRYLAWKARQ